MKIVPQEVDETAGNGRLHEPESPSSMSSAKLGITPSSDKSSIISWGTPSMPTTTLLLPSLIFKTTVISKGSYLKVVEKLLKFRVNNPESFLNPDRTLKMERP